MPNLINPHDDPTWNLNDPRYVANYLIDELEYLAFQMRTLIQRLDNLDIGIVKLRAMKHNTLVNILLDFIQAWEGNVFSATDLFKTVGIQSRKTKNKTFSYLSVFVRQGRIYRGKERGTYTKNPPAPSDDAS